MTDFKEKIRAKEAVQIRKLFFCRYLALSLSKDLIAQSKRISFFAELAIFFAFSQRYNKSIVHKNTTEKQVKRLDIMMHRQLKKQEVVWSKILKSKS